MDLVHCIFLKGLNFVPDILNFLDFNLSQIINRDVGELFRCNYVSLAQKRWFRFGLDPRRSIEVLIFIIDYPPRSFNIVVLCNCFTFQQMNNLLTQFLAHNVDFILVITNNFGDFGIFDTLRAFIFFYAFPGEHLDIDDNTADSLRSA